MALHDYTCPYDGIVLLDQYRPAAVGGRLAPPCCPSCARLMEWIPRARFDLRSDASGGSFAKFETLDGQNRPVVVDSLHRLRQIERASEQQARDGEGQHVTFRAWANDRSNRDVNTHGDSPLQGPTPEAAHRFGLQQGTTRHATEPDRPFGPRVNASNTSALPMSGTD